MTALVGAAGHKAAGLVDDGAASLLDAAPTSPRRTQGGPVHAMPRHRGPPSADRLPRPPETAGDPDFLLVGGVAAIAYGAVRPTEDLDCLARRTGENLARLSVAMRELNARLRVGGLADAEAAALPTQLDADTLGRMEISTWRTDAGDFDVLTDIPAAMATGCATTNWSAAPRSRTSMAGPSTWPRWRM